MCYNVWAHKKSFEYCLHLAATRHNFRPQFVVMYSWTEYTLNVRMNATRTGVRIKFDELINDVCHNAPRHIRTSVPLWCEWQTNDHKHIQFATRNRTKKKNEQYWTNANVSIAPSINPSVSMCVVLSRVMRYHPHNSTFERRTLPCNTLNSMNT